LGGAAFQQEAEWRNAASVDNPDTRRRHFELAEMLRIKSMLNGPRRSATLLK